MTRPTLRTVLCAITGLLTVGTGAPLHGQAGESPRTVLSVQDTAGLLQRAHMGTLEDDLARVHEITGEAAGPSRLVRRLSTPALPGSGFGFEVGALPATVRLLRNSGYPSGGNDGLLWAGRGVSALLRAGAYARWGPVSVGLAPELAAHQNSEFPIRTVAREGYSPFANRFSGGIDLPQRFGPEPFRSAALGQSYARVDVGAFAAGAATENLWWGPAARYPLLMSNNAAGFPHLFAGIARPLGVLIGTLEAELLWGGLRESAYFDGRPENDWAALAALVGSFSPYVLPGLSLGFARVYQYRPDDGRWSSDPGPVLEVFGGSGINRPGNELFSVFGRWVFPASGAELYGEWGREDRWIDWRELVQEPDHSQAYMFGFQKLTSLTPDVALRVQLEAIALQATGELRTGSRPLPTWYTHSQITQGFTHRGQVLGAWIGPGSDAQFLAVDAVVPWGLWGGYIERVRRWDASTAALDARRWSPYEHDTELTFGARALALPRADLSAAATLSYSYRFNREFLEDDSNVGLELTLTWAPPGTLP